MFNVSSVIGWNVILRDRESKLISRFIHQTLATKLGERNHLSHDLLSARVHIKKKPE